MGNKVYISCPLTVDMKHIQGVEKVLKDIGFAVNFWNRSWPSSKYSDDPVRYCDIFVIIFPDGKWSTLRTLLPAGTYKELKLAIECGKPIYLGYLGAMTSSYAIYQTEYDNDRIGGVKGSSNHIKAFAPTPTTSTKIDGTKSFQNRLDEIFPKQTIDSKWPEIAPSLDFDNNGMPIYPESWPKPAKSSYFDEKLDYDERLLLFYKPSK